MPPAVFVLMPRAVMTPVPVTVVEGAAPAPPPIIRAFAASAADDPIVPELTKYGTPPEFTTPETVAGKLRDGAEDEIV